MESYEQVIASEAKMLKAMFASRTLSVTELLDVIICGDVEKALADCPSVGLASMSYVQKNYFSKAKSGGEIQRGTIITFEIMCSHVVFGKLLTYAKKCSHAKITKSNNKSNVSYMHNMTYGGSTVRRYMFNFYKRDGHITGATMTQKQEEVSADIFRKVLRNDFDKNDELCVQKWWFDIAATNPFIDDDWYATYNAQFNKIAELKKTKFKGNDYIVDHERDLMKSMLGWWKSNIGTDINTWNPMDVWIYNDKAATKIRKLLADNDGIKEWTTSEKIAVVNEINKSFREMFKTAISVGVSLKKISTTKVKWEEFNVYPSKDEKYIELIEIVTDLKTAFENDRVNHIKVRLSIMDGDSRKVEEVYINLKLRGDKVIFEPKKAKGSSQLGKVPTSVASVFFGMDFKTKAGVFDYLISKSKREVEELLKRLILASMKIGTGFGPHGKMS